MLMLQCDVIILPCEVTNSGYPTDFQHRPYCKSEWKSSDKHNRTWKKLNNNITQKEKDRVWIHRGWIKKCMKTELLLKSMNGVFQGELLSVCSQRAARGALEKEKKTARRRNRGRQKHRETGTWKTRLELSSSQLGLWKSIEARCEAVFCCRSVPFPFSFSLLRACGFLITVSLNQCLFPWSIFWWIKAITPLGSGQSPSDVFSTNSTLCVCHFFPPLRSCLELWTRVSWGQSLSVNLDLYQDAMLKARQGPERLTQHPYMENEAPAAPNKASKFQKMCYLYWAP